jgi:hypothetical protein
VTALGVLLGLVAMTAATVVLGLAGWACDRGSDR